MTATAGYVATRDRVEDYFDRTATSVWERLTSDAPVSGIRATVRAGRDRMRAMMLAELPADLRGTRVLDAGCGTGAMAVELVARGAQVLAIDISPALIGIAKDRAGNAAIDWRAGDMTDAALGSFDHVVAMDSMIYYTPAEVAAILGGLRGRVSGRIVITLPPRTPLLMAMYRVGKLLPRSDRSPAMVPQSARALRAALTQASVPGTLREAGRVSTGFYKSAALVHEEDRA